MTFPTIQFKATNTTLEGELQDVLERKLTSLDKYLGDETDVLCAVEFEKEAARQQGKIFRVEVNLTKAGTLHRAEATEESFEKAIDTVRNELDKLLRRTAKKRDTLVKRGGRAIKDMMKK